MSRNTLYTKLKKKKINKINTQEMFKLFEKTNITEPVNPYFELTYSIHRNEEDINYQGILS